MELKERTIVSSTYTLNMTREELKEFKFIIDYAWHRATKHVTPLTAPVYQDFLRELKDKMKGGGK